MLYTLTLTLSKLSILLLFRRITPVKSHLTIIWATIVFTAAWGFASTIATMFTCDVPHVWAVFTGHCYQRVGLLYCLAADIGG